MGGGGPAASNFLMQPPIFALGVGSWLLVIEFEITNGLYRSLKGSKDNFQIDLRLKKTR